MIFALVLALFLVQTLQAIKYVDVDGPWTVYDAKYTVLDGGGLIGRSVELSSSGRTFVLVRILRDGNPFYPSNYTSEFGNNANNFYAHVHADPCNSNNGTHWKFNPSTPGAVESNELWFKFDTIASPLFSEALTPNSHVVPETFDPKIKSLTIHEPLNVGTNVAAKLACIDLTTSNVGLGRTHFSSVFSSLVLLLVGMFFF